jgi:hypothetical protein
MGIPTRESGRTFFAGFKGALERGHGVELALLTAVLLVKRFLVCGEHDGRASGRSERRRRERESVELRAGHMQPSLHGTPDGVPDQIGSRGRARGARSWRSKRAEWPVVRVLCSRWAALAILDRGEGYMRRRRLEIEPSTSDGIRQGDCVGAGIRLNSEHHDRWRTTAMIRDR